MLTKDFQDGQVTKENIEELIKVLQLCKNVTTAQISAEKPYQKLNKSEKDKKHILDLCKLELESWRKEDAAGSGEVIDRKDGGQGQEIEFKNSDDECKMVNMQCRIENLSECLSKSTSDDLFSKTFANIIMAKYLDTSDTNLDINDIPSAAVDSCGKIVDQKLDARVKIIDHGIQSLNAILQTRFSGTKEVKQYEDGDEKDDRIFQEASEVCEAIIEKIRPQVKDYLLNTYTTEQARFIRNINNLFRECEANGEFSKLSYDRKMALFDKVNNKVESAATDKMTTGGFMLFMFIMAAYTAYRVYNDVGSQCPADPNLNTTAHPRGVMPSGETGQAVDLPPEVKFLYQILNLNPDWVKELFQKFVVSQGESFSPLPHLRY